MKTLKALAVTALLVAMVTAAAASLGSFASKTEKKVEGNQASFYISVFNLAEETYQLEMNSEELEGAKIYHPDSYTVAPSKQTENPEEGGNWFAMENGKYVKTAEIPIDFQKLPETNNRNFEFTVTVKARPEKEVKEDGSTFHKIQQVRSYTFNVKTRPQSREEGEETFTIPAREEQNDTRRGMVETAQKTLDSLNPFTGEDKTLTQQSPETEIESEPVREEDGKEERSTPDNFKQTEKNKETSTGGFFASGSHITLALLAGVAATTLYLFRVV